MLESNILAHGAVSEKVKWELRVMADDRNREACDIVFRYIEVGSWPEKITYRQSVPMERAQFLAIGKHMGWI